VVVVGDNNQWLGLRFCGPFCRWPAPDDSRAPFFCTAKDLLAKVPVRGRVKYHERPFEQVRRSCRLASGFAALLSQTVGASCWPDPSQWMESTPVTNLDEHLLSVLGKLEECRATLLANSSRETAELVSVAILELRMKLNGIDDAELKALCDELTMRAEDEERPRELKSAHGHRRRPLLRLVK
jgi:hypothetical protein